MTTEVSTEAELRVALGTTDDVRVASGVTIPLSAPLNVERPLRLSGAGPTSVISVTGGPAVQLYSSDVEICGLTIYGGLEAGWTPPPVTGDPGEDPPGVYDVTQKLIWGHGTAVAPLERLVIRDNVLRGSRADNLWLEWTEDALVANNTIEEYRYSGILMISARRARIVGNAVRDALLTADVPQVYGIALTDLDNTDEARTRDTLVVGNHVTLVDWEGIETHGGVGLTITGNHVRGCPRGIAVITGNNTRLFAPEDVLVAGNTIDGLNSRIPLLAGVFLGGLPAQGASGTIVGNQILNYPASEAFVTSYWARGDTRIGANSVPQVPYANVTMGADYTANGTYPPRYRVDGDVVHIDGGAIPRSGGVAVRTVVGQLPNPAAWPDRLTVLGLIKGSSPTAGNAQLAVTSTGQVQLLYGTGTDTFTYWLTGSYAVP